MVLAGGYYPLPRQRNVTGTEFLSSVLYQAVPAFFHPCLRLIYPLPMAVLRFEKTFVHYKMTYTISRLNVLHNSTSAQLLLELQKSLP